MSIVSAAFTCPNCGAQLHPSGSEATITCEFCGATSSIAVAPPEQRTPRASPSAPSRGRPWRWVALGLVPLLAGGVWLASRQPPAASTGSTIASLPAAVQSAVTALARTPTEWRSAPIVADVNGDGAEDILGQWDADGHCVTGLIDGETRRVLFSVVQQQNCGWPQPFTLAGNLLVLTPSQTPSVELYELPAGKDVGRVDLDHPPTLLLGHGHEVWADLSGAQVLFDTTTRTVAPWKK